MNKFAEGKCNSFLLIISGFPASLIPCKEISNQRFSCATGKASYLDIMGNLFETGHSEI